MCCFLDVAIYDAPLRDRLPHEVFGHLAKLAENMVALAKRDEPRSDVIGRIMHASHDAVITDIHAVLLQRLDALRYGFKLGLHGHKNLRASEHPLKAVCAYT